MVAAARARQLRLHAIGALVLLALALAAVAPAGAHAAASIGLSTGTFKFNTIPDKTLKGDLFVSNEGDRPITVLVYSADIVPDAKGVPQFVKPRPGVQPQSNSPASWTEIRVPDSTRIINNAPYLELDIGERSHVFFEIEVPPKSPPGDYSQAIFFEMFGLEARRGTTSRIGGRLGCRIQVRVQGKIVENVSVRPFAVGDFVFGSALPYSFTINNDGNIDHDFASTLQLLSSDEDVKQRVVVGKSDYVYARSKKVFNGKAPLRDMGLGKYTAELRVSYLKETPAGAGKTSRARTEIVGTRDFYVIPMWAVVLLLVLLVVIIFVLITIPLRRRRRRRAQLGGAPSGPAGPGPGRQPQPPAQPQGPPISAATGISPGEPPESEPAVWEASSTEEAAPTGAAAPEAEAAPAREAPAEEPILPAEVMPEEEEPPAEEAPEEERPMAETPVSQAETEGPDWRRSWGEVKHYGPPSGSEKEE